MAALSHYYITEDHTEKSIISSYFWALYWQRILSEVYIKDKKPKNKKLTNSVLHRFTFSSNIKTVTLKFMCIIGHSKHIIVLLGTKVFTIKKVAL